MKQILQTLGGDLRIEDVPPPRPRAGGVLVRNVASLVSVGTERANVAGSRRSLAQRAADRPDLVRQVARMALANGIGATVDLVKEKLESPLPLGYSSAGIVEQVGAGCELRPGDRVCCAGGGYAVHAELIWVPRNLCVPLDLDRGGAERVRVPFEAGAFGAVGAIALQGVRTANVAVGESVLVVGLGLIGLITVQILRAAGCTVIGVDPDAQRVELAMALGAHAALAGGRVDDQVAAGHLDGAIRALTADAGVDATLITASTDRADPMVLATSCTRQGGVVVVVGDVPIAAERQVLYDKELRLAVSRSYGPGRHDPKYEEGGVDYPLPYVRWTEGRNIAGFLALVADGSVDVSALVSHRFEIQNALDAYALISGTPRVPHLGVVITYPDANGTGVTPASVVDRPPSPARRRESARIGVGLVGAGSFARNTLLPILKRLPVDLRGVATTSGASATYVGRRFGFGAATTDIGAVLADSATDLIVIATRHASHADLVARAVDAGKHVFVEKPLCISRAQLAALQPTLERARASGLHVVVGFNRRFAPLLVKTRHLLSDRRGPLALHYRVNAGRIPREHWVNDPDVGGGRIIGEVCHFVDVANYLVGLPAVTATAVPLAGDSVLCTLRYADDSTATIQYLDIGHPALPKEYLEVSADGMTAIIDDFRRATWLTLRGRERSRMMARQDKGHRAELEMLVHALSSSGPVRPTVEEIVAVTETTFDLVDSMR